MTDPSSLTVTTTVNSDTTQPSMPKATIPDLLSPAKDPSIVFHSDLVNHMTNVVTYLKNEADKQQELLTLVETLHTNISGLKNTLNLKIDEIRPSINAIPMSVLTEVQTVTTTVEKQVGFFEKIIKSLFNKKK